MSHKTISPDEVRSKYLKFFESKQHLIYPSASLKSDDPALMFNIAGMQQFKPYFQGAEPRFVGFEGLHPRVTTSQKCMRAGGKDSDIENVGRTRRHHTFFEMLGNFSFGDYFKKEAIAWAWEFLTGEAWLALDPALLYVTVYLDDDDAYNFWLETGVDASHISRFGEGENFWPANAVKDERQGPCGPCSEIFYDRGEGFGSADETGPNTGDGDRYVEIWNLVFTQYNLQDGELIPLPQTNIDTGGGLERMTATITGAKDAYATELFQPMIRRVVEYTGVPYNDIESVQHRIIADHSRSTTMAIADGILPASDGAGYVIRMLIRRAARQAYLLGVREPILHRLVAGVVEAMGAAYPELQSAEERITAIVKNEEEQFFRTLEAGMARVTTLLDELEGDTLSGEVAFDLWQTYGFPLDLTQEIAEERGISIDRAGYGLARDNARLISKSGSDDVDVFATGEAHSEVYAEIYKQQGATTFTGYDTMQGDGSVLGFITDDGSSEQVSEGQECIIVLDSTPFYAESGGQIGDMGVLEWAEGRALVSTTSKNKAGIVQHHAKILRGTLQRGSSVSAKVDPCRVEICKHHTATHLLHAALREVVGNHVAQAGSLVEAGRLRFDISHHQAVSAEEMRAVETKVNQWIQADLPVTWRTMPLEEARETGAMMLFGEKYADIVRVVTVGEGAFTPSLELCGGVHVSRTGTLGTFLISNEGAASAGVRRLEALTGMAAVEHINELRQMSQQLASAFNAKVPEIPERLQKLQRELKDAQKEISNLRDKLTAAQTGGSAGNEVKEVAGYSYASVSIDGLDKGALRNAADTLLSKSKADIALVQSGTQLVVKVAEEAKARGAHAGNIIKAIATKAGGGGGGRPDMAMAGVKDDAALMAVLAEVDTLLQGVLA